MNVQDVIRDLEQKLLVDACESVSTVTGNKIKTVAVKKAVIVENLLTALLTVPEEDEEKLVQGVFDLAEELQTKLEAGTIREALDKIKVFTAELATGGPGASAVKPPKKSAPTPDAPPAADTVAEKAAAKAAKDAEKAAAKDAKAAEKAAAKAAAAAVPKAPAPPSNLRKLTAVICENVERPRAEVMELVKALDLDVKESTINAEYANVKRVYDVAKSLGML